MDPIAELVRDLEDDGAPSLEWVVRWSQGGVEPVLAAWRASSADHKMRMLLVMVRHPAVGDTHADDGEYPRSTRCSDRCGLVYCSRCADAIRTVVPVPTTLADLLAARQKR